MRLSNPDECFFQDGVHSTRSRTRNPRGPGNLSTAVTNSGNRKTGKIMATYVTQSSCPNGTNASHRCPLLGIACYGEEGLVKLAVMGPLNRESGFDMNDPSAGHTPEECAIDEVAAMDQQYKKWNKNRTPARLHIVGDCVTSKAARILSAGAEKFSYRPDKWPRNAKSIWCYTHAWRDVPRSAWSPNISILASCDKYEQLGQAHAAGYATAIVVDQYSQVAMAKYGASYEVGGGFKIVPCPAVVNTVVEVAENTMVRAALRLRKAKVPRGTKPDQRYEMLEASEQEAIRKDIEKRFPRQGTRSRRKQVQCIDCKLCMQDDNSRAHKHVIAFALHGLRAIKAKGKLTNGGLIQIDVK